MKRRLFMVILAAMFVFSSIPVMHVSAAADIEIDYDVDEETIRKDEFFTLHLFLNEGDANIDEETVSFSIDESNGFFKVINSPDISDFEFGKDYTFGMQYLGGSDKVPVKVEYEDEDEKDQTITINVEITQIDEDSSSSSSGNSDKEPKLLIESTSIPSAAAGDTMKIPLTIRNDSKYTARNISVKLALDDMENSPFDVDSLNLTQTIDSLSANKGEGVIFNLKVKPYAEEKTYVLSVEFKFDNGRGTDFTDEETIYVKVTNNKNEPALIIQDIRYSTNPVKAGEKMQVSFNVSNMGDLDAEGVKVSVEGLKKEEFTLSSGVDSWYFDKIEGNEKKNIILSLIAADSMGSGNYGLEIKMDYKDQRNTAYSNSSSFFVGVQGETKSSNVAVETITVMPQEVKTNENFMLSFDIYNKGKSTARNVKVTVKGDEGIISKSPDVTIVEQLAAGERKRLEIILYANNEAKAQNYNILINIEYEDVEKEDSKYSVNQYAGIYVNGVNSKITPKIIISNYNFEPKLVRAGDEFSLDLTFMNASSTKEVKNVKIYLTGIDSDKEGNVVFTPVGSSNTFFVDSIKPKGTAVRGITMYTIPDAQPKYYNITANIEYQDDDGTEYKAAELIGIPVIQQSRLDASEISLPPEVYIGQPSPVSLQYYNKGKTKLSNLMIKIEGDFQVENGEAFIGNFESGSSDYFEAMLTAMKPGAANGKVIFSYEDPSGEEFTYEREFTINAMEMPPMEMPGEMPPAEVSTKDKIMNMTIKNKFFWIGAAVIAAGIFTSRRLIRKRRRKDMELDE
ncbi:MAG TPA: CARDB domain-containing protein [Clostridia bacterium]|nr:CARDB domain-containing protein [Clostridia bacterium]